jgi:hypothetical protein
MRFSLKMYGIDELSWKWTHDPFENFESERSSLKPCPSIIQAKKLSSARPKLSREHHPIGTRCQSSPQSMLTTMSVDGNFGNVAGCCCSLLAVVSGRTKVNILKSLAFSSSLIIC